MGGGGSGGASSGGGGAGGVVVSGPSPIAAMFAGMMQSDAAKQAAQAASDATAQAISTINRHYLQARADVQPYRTQGVQALNQLNQYLQLSPYNPGSAPRLEMADLKKQVTNSQINNYINENSSLTPHGAYVPFTNTLRSGKDGTAYAFKYTGAGSEDPEFVKGYEDVWKNQLGNPIYPGGIMSTQNPTTLYNHFTNLDGLTSTGQPIALDAASAFSNDTNLKERIRTYLAQQQYDELFPDHQRNLEEWQQNKNWYDQKMAEGPYTQQQISDKITNLPGYQAELNAGIDTIKASGAARGYTGSGRILRELGMHGQNTLSTFYNNELGRLAELAGMGANAAGASAEAGLNAGMGKGSLLQSLGDTKANSYLASGNAIAQALIAANTEHKIIGGGDGGGGGGGGGMGGIGSILGGIGSIMSAFPSSRKIKKKVKRADTKSLLSKMAKLDVDYWKYNKGVHDEKEHIGPYAEDFAEAFGVGDGKTIDVISYLGVLTGSIKELAKKAVKHESKRTKSNAR